MRLTPAPHQSPIVCECTPLVTGQCVRPPAIPLLCNAELYTLALRQRDPRLLTPDHEHVRLPCRELVIDGILDVDDVETTVVALTVSDDADTTHVATAGGHRNHAGVEGDELGNLACSVCQHP